MGHLTSENPDLRKKSADYFEKNQNIETYELTAEDLSEIVV